ncbi:MAG: dihydroorotase, partial [Bacteroidaceae bacterium]|nr:dihydroorotase [Bacteroidaceae bacterium]
MNYIIKNGNIVSEDKVFVGDILISNDKITKISCTKITDYPEETKVVDATNCYVLPGIIDTHVHFREPGLTHKADIESESRAA